MIGEYVISNQKTLKLIKFEGFYINAEREGFEPPEPCGSTVFKTAAFDRSAISLNIGMQK